MVVTQRTVQMSCVVWLRGRNIDASKKIFVVTELLIFELEPYIGG